MEQNLYVVLISAVSNLLFLKMNRSLDRDWRMLQDPLPEPGLQIFRGKPICLRPLQTSGGIHLRLRRQPVIHRHRQGLSWADEAALPRCLSA